MASYLSIEKITYGSFYQRKIDQTYVDELVEQTRANGNSPTWPPVKLTTRFMLIDGQHRLEAAKKLGLSSIEVDYIETQEPFIESVKANLTHGQRFTPEEKAKIIYILADEQKKSTRDIGKILQCDHTTVGRILRKRNEVKEKQEAEKSSDDKVMRRFVSVGLMVNQQILRNDEYSEKENAEWFDDKLIDELKRIHKKDEGLLFELKHLCERVLEVYERIEASTS